MEMWHLAKSERRGFDSSTPHQIYSAIKARPNHSFNWKQWGMPPFGPPFHGRSDGIPTAELLKRDSVDLYRFIKSKAKNRVLVHGLSLGSFMATSIAESEPIDGLILEGAPTNAEDQVRALFPWYVGIFVRPRISAELLSVNNVKALKNYKGPLLLLTGENDELVPPALQRSLYEKARSSKKYIHFFPGFGHKGLIESPEFTRVLNKFIADSGA